VHRSVARDYGVYWSDWNANSRATFIIDRNGTIRFIERYAKGQLPDPDKILAEVKKLG
jgi:alkyl hydroperoxide reductase subunit AhpC